jgi:uncharacterized protein YndB with AHSA1/START domain
METLMVHESVDIAAPRAEVAKAIASPHGLATWLSNDARSDRRAGGLLVCEWWSGPTWLGEWTTYEPPDRLAWRHREGLDGALSSVSFALEDHRDGTRVRLTHGDLPAADAGTAAEAWRERLEDLRVYAERGIEAREGRRALLGVSFEPLDEGMAAERGLPLTRGVLVVGTLPDGGADRAGLQTGDVIVKLDDTDVAEWRDLAAFLGGRSSGDEVQVTYWRGDEQVTCSVTTQPPEAPRVPTEPGEVRAYIASSYEDMSRDLRETLSGVSEDEASFRPGDDAWSIKEILAHLVLGETYHQDWVTREIVDGPRWAWPEGAERIRMPVTAARSVDALVDELDVRLRETEALSLRALDAEAPPPLRQACGQGAHFSKEHFDEHIAQMRANLEAARGS